MNKTKIEWCDASWNPVVGCRGSCPYCYARKMAHRFHRDFIPHWEEKNFQKSMPKEPSRIFVNSMSEIADWEPEWWRKVIERITVNSQHRFLFLTKHPSIYSDYYLPTNCWYGATATNQIEVYYHQHTFGPILNHICYLSIEPLFEYINPMSIDKNYINWVILGAETGNRKERVIPPPEWIKPWLTLPIPLYMKSNLPWSGPWRREFPCLKP